LEQAAGGAPFPVPRHRPGGERHAGRLLGRRRLRSHTTATKKNSHRSGSSASNVSTTRNSTAAAPNMSPPRATPAEVVMQGNSRPIPPAISATPNHDPQPARVAERGEHLEHLGGAGHLLDPVLDEEPRGQDQERPARDFSARSRIVVRILTTFPAA